MAQIRTVAQNDHTKKWAYIEFSDENINHFFIIGDKEFDTQEEAESHKVEMDKQNLNVSVQNKVELRYFSLALGCLKEGCKVARKSWNGKMFLILIKENEWSIPDKSIVEGQIIPLSSFIAMKTADNELIPWSTSQPDILAEDWTVVE